MKNKNFTKFTKRNTHKRRARDAAKAELLRAVREVGVDPTRVKFKDRLDLGRRGRESSAPHRDETVAEGVFCGSRAGFGFVKLEGEDIFIPDGRCGAAIDGDLVEIVFHRYENRFGEEKTEGRVRKIIEYGRRFAVGEVDEEYHRHGRRVLRRQVFIADGGRLHPNPEIVGGKDCRTGDKVEVRLLREGGYLAAEVTKNFGPSYTREANYQGILAECEIDTEFTPEELSEAENAARVPISDEGRVRRDREIIFTIDGEGAKDLDDAVSLVRIAGGGYRLGVHIADVSHYVKERTPLDRCVMSRGTSVYFTDKVVPMLPKSLSNGACSLNPGEDKYTLSAIIDLNSDGSIRNLKLEPSIIRSRVRGVYSEVNSIFDSSASLDIRKKYKEVLPALDRMRELYEILLKRHQGRGAIDFYADEAVIILDDKGDPCEIIPRERGEAERMIEQFMLTANEAVATALSKQSIPCVYRIHEQPKPEKLGELLTFAHNLGLNIAGINAEQPDSYALGRLLQQAEERGIFDPVSYVMLRTMSKAKYSEIRSPHFGLGIEYYCHFTSPIRRLSDLATHRIIKKVLIEGKTASAYASYARRAAAAATEGELRAVNAERRIEDLYKCVFMSKFIGEEFEGAVCSVTSYGLFVKLNNTCEGLIPISEMPGECRYDEGNVTLVSRRRIYRLGERINVRVEECDITGGKIRFSLVEKGRSDEKKN